jgi:hypothetical protein
MFISTKDKEAINFSIEDLYSRVEKLGRSLNAVLDQLTTKAETTKVEDKNKLSKARQAKRNAYAKAYYYKKKAEKANLTKQGKI